MTSEDGINWTQVEVIEALHDWNWQNTANVLHELLKEEKNRAFHKTLIDLEKSSQLVANVRVSGVSSHALLGQENIMSKLGHFGERFEREYLCKEYLNSKNVDIEQLEENWWEALKFFLTRIFYQGRRDDISVRVEKKVLGVLGKYFNDSLEREENFQALKASSWSQLRVDLQAVIGKGKVGRGRDIDMIIDTFEFISRLPDKNIVRYSVEMIKNNKLEQTWYGLQKSKSKDGIRSVGKKIASLYLRDLVTILSLEQKVSNYHQIFLQPIDTWVRQTAKKIGIEETRNEMKLRRMIIERCGRVNQSAITAIRFNEGAWYIGSHSLEILLGTLMKH